MLTAATKAKVPRAAVGVNDIPPDGEPPEFGPLEFGMEPPFWFGKIELRVFNNELIGLGKTAGEGVV